MVVELGPDGHWYRNCHVCHQVVVNSARGEGPWCDLYCDERGELCYPRVVRLLNEADARGDGPYVNALCAYGRQRWGETIHW